MIAYGELGRRESWLILKKYSDIHLDQPRNTTRNVSQGSRYSVQDLNRAPPGRMASPV
jgi:hypothetical protein